MDEEQNKKVKFVCPNCGAIAQDDVVFLCNTCQSNEVEEIDGVFMCSSCKIEVNPLMCRICQSKQVHMHGKTINLPSKDHPHK